MMLSDVCHSVCRSVLAFQLIQFFSCGRRFRYFLFSASIIRRRRNRRSRRLLLRRRPALRSQPSSGGGVMAAKGRPPFPFPPVRFVTAVTRPVIRQCVIGVHILPHVRFSGSQRRILQEILINAVAYINRMRPGENYAWLRHR